MTEYTSESYVWWNVRGSYSGDHTFKTEQEARECYLKLCEDEWESLVTMTKHQVLMKCEK